jgi:AraC family transcriptional regulator of adaptative response/methylated-DNA-[protein]-cysteine methyltransferase
MLFDLPEPAILYEALLKRDPDYDGRAYVGVSSTGIFCRLTCPARKPRPENCSFYASVGECIQAGFRACKRCHPMAPAAEADPAVKALLEALSERKGHRWSEARHRPDGFRSLDRAAILQPAFRNDLLEMARLERLRHAHLALAGGSKVIEAQLDAGFESPGAFRAAFARLMGKPPGSFCADAMLRADYIDTPLGPMIALCDRTHLHLLEFADRKALPAELRRMHQVFKGGIGFGRHAPLDLWKPSSTRIFRAATRISASPWHFMAAISPNPSGMPWSRSRPGKPGTTAQLPRRSDGRPLSAPWRAPMAPTRSRFSCRATASLAPTGP